MEGSNAGFSPDLSAQCKKFKVNIESENTLAIDLWKSRKFTDAVLIVCGEQFHVHRMVLASQLEYFRSMWYGEMQEASETEVKLEGLEDIATPSVFNEVLKFAYTKSLNTHLPLNEIIGIIRVADFLSFDDLFSTLLKHVVEQHVCHDTVLPLYEVSYMYSDQLAIVQEKCLQFFENHSNTNEMLTSSVFLELSEECLIALISEDRFVAPELAILQAVLSWKKRNNIRRMSKVARCIRMNRFTIKEIFSEVEPAGFFSAEQILAGVRVHNKQNLSEITPRGRIRLGEDLLMEALFNQTRDRNFSLGRNIVRSRRIDEDKDGDIRLLKCYLANFLCFEAYPSDGYNKWFSYTITVSVDSCGSRLKLIDYSSFHCRGKQILTFPTVPIRSLTIHVPSKEKSETALPVKVSALQFSETFTKFKFLKNGVIAPLHNLSVNFKAENPNPKTVVAYFNQPYSVSTLSLELTYDDPIADMEVTLKIDGKDVLAHHLLKKKDMRSPLVIDVIETVIMILEVTIHSSYLSNAEHGISRPGHQGAKVGIKSILCKSSATTDEVNTEEFWRYMNSVAN